jgi:hypothetical protein
MDKIPTLRPPMDGEGGDDRDSRTVLAFLAVELVEPYGEGARLDALRPQAIGRVGLGPGLRPPYINPMLQ